MHFHVMIISKRHLIRIRGALGVGVRNQCESPMVDILTTIQVCRHNNTVIIVGMLCTPSLSS